MHIENKPAFVADSDPQIDFFADFKHSMVRVEQEDQGQSAVRSPSVRSRVDRAIAAVRLLKFPQHFV